MTTEWPGIKWVWWHDKYMGLAVMGICHAIQLAQLAIWIRWTIDSLRDHLRQYWPRHRSFFMSSGLRYPHRHIHTYPANTKYLFYNGFFGHKNARKNSFQFNVFKTLSKYYRMTQNILKNFQYCFPQYQSMIFKRWEYFLSWCLYDNIIAFSAMLVYCFKNIIKAFCILTMFICFHEIKCYFHAMVWKCY